MADGPEQEAGLGPAGDEEGGAGRPAPADALGRVEAEVRPLLVRAVAGEAASGQQGANPRLEEVVPRGRRPLGGLAPMWLMQLGEVIFGGVGSGLYGMLMYVIVAVFVAGLMVGRTPEYLGKKIEAYEMKMASLVILIPPLVVLVGTAIAVSGPGLDYVSGEEVKSNLNNPGAHGFSEVLYNFSSAGNNNGSAFGGMTAGGDASVS